MVGGYNRYCNLVFGEVTEDKYINDKYNFSLSVPKGWIVNEDIKKVNGIKTFIPKTEELIIARMTSISNEERYEYEVDDYSSLTIYSINSNNIGQVVEDMSNTSGFKSSTKEKIKERDFFVLNYNDNSKMYLVESNDKILEFLVTPTNNNNYINTLVDSIEFY